MIIALWLVVLYGLIRLWFLRYVSKSMHHPIWYNMLIAIVWGCIITGIILRTPWLIWRVSMILLRQWDQWIHFQTVYAPYITISVLIIYSIIWIVLYSYIPQSRMSISIGTSIWYISSLIISRGIWSWMFPLKGLLRYLIIVVEEFLKIIVSLLRHHQESNRSNDLIMIWMIAGLWFWIVENSRYIIQQVQTSSSIGLVSLAWMRSVSSSIIHMCCTGGIARLIAKQYHQSYIGVYAALAIMLFVSYHWIYNMSLQYMPIMALILIIWWYLLLSRYLYDSDLLYISTEE
jgi:RsiW-degrading membrane proteinase PrsW (M82 family)